MLFEKCLKMDELFIERLNLIFIFFPTVDTVWIWKRGKAHTKMKNELPTFSSNLL